MKFHLHHVGLAALLSGALLSGIVNNVLSAICVVMATVCWLAAAQLRKDGFVIGLLSVIGWLLVAGLCSTLFWQGRG